MELNNLLETMTKRSYIRSIAQRCEKADRCNNFFGNLETRRQSNNVINQIKTTSGNLVHKQSKLIKELALFYKNLFKSKNIDNDEISQYLSKINACNN